MNLSPKKTKSDDLDESLQSYSRSQLMELMQQHEQQQQQQQMHHTSIATARQRPSASSCPFIPSPSALVSSSYNASSNASHTLLPPGRRLDAGDDHEMEPPHCFSWERNRWNPVPPPPLPPRALRHATSSLTEASSEDAPMSIDGANSLASNVHSSEEGNSTITQASPPLLVAAATSHSRRSLFSWSGARTSSQLSLATSRGSTAAELECLYRGASGSTTMHRQSSLEDITMRDDAQLLMASTQYLVRNTSQASVRRRPERPDNPMVGQLLHDYYGGGECDRSSSLGSSL